MFRSFKRRVAAEQIFSLVAGKLDYTAVGGEIGNFQVYGHAALQSALEVAGAAHAQIGLRNEKTISGRRHYLKTLARLAGDGTFGHEYTEALRRPASHPATKLMQL